MTKSRALQAVMTLLAERSFGATICPSEVARALVSTGDDAAPDKDWRSAMPEVHAAVDQLDADGKVRLSWKGNALARRAGPYRIARRHSD